MRNFTRFLLHALDQATPRGLRASQFIDQKVGDITPQAGFGHHATGGLISARRRRALQTTKATGCFSRRAAKGVAGWPCDAVAKSA